MSRLPEPPAGGLIVDVIAKVLGGYEPGDRRSQQYLNSLGRDHLWLRQDEVETLAAGTLPDSVKQRLVRYHLIDNTRGSCAAVAVLGELGAADAADVAQRRAVPGPALCDFGERAVVEDDERRHADLRGPPGVGSL